MTIFSVYIINKAGSLIYHYDAPNTTRPAVEKTFSYPLELVLKVFDEKVTVAFGERDGIKGEKWFKSLTLLTLIEEKKMFSLYFCHLL